MASGSRSPDPPHAGRPEDSGPRAEADRLFWGFLERWYRGEEVDFESYCRDHAEHATELRRRHQEWRRVTAVLERLAPPSSIADRLRSDYGADLGADLTLEPDTALPGESPDDSLSKWLLRLAERGLLKS